MVNNNMLWDPDPILILARAPSFSVLFGFIQFMIFCLIFFAILVTYLAHLRPVLVDSHFKIQLFWYDMSMSSG